MLNSHEGRSLFLLERFEEAKQVWQRGVQLFPGCWYHHHMLGKSLQSLYSGNVSLLQAARDAFEEAHRLAPTELGPLEFGVEVGALY